MNSRLATGIVIAIFGILLVGAGSLMAMRLFDIRLSTPETSITPEPEKTVQVAVVSGDVAAGQVLSADQVVMNAIPAQYVPRDVIENLENVIGKITKVDLFQGEMILDHNLANPTSQVYDVAYLLDETHVLMALPATDLMSREALIKRGDLIDILVSSLETLQQVGETAAAGQENSPQLVTFSALQKVNITALVVDIVRSDNENNPEPVNTIPRREEVVVQTYLVALDPQDALILKYLKDSGAVFDYVLRAPTSTGKFDLVPVTSEYIKELYGLDLLP